MKIFIHVIISCQESVNNKSVFKEFGITFFKIGYYYVFNVFKFYYSNILIKECIHITSFLFSYKQYNYKIILFLLIY